MLEDGDDTTIAEWLDLDVNFSQDSQDEDKPEPPDIFVIGLQEVGLQSSMIDLLLVEQC